MAVGHALCRIEYFVSAGNAGDGERPAWSSDSHNLSFWNESATLATDEVGWI